MNTTAVRDRLIAPASLRSAWLISRACSPGSESPMSPSISAFGTSAATRPRGMPPMPIAASRLIAPVGMASTRTRGASAPIRMMAPLPHVFSICVIARLRALRRSSVSLGASLSAAMSILDIGWEPPRERPEYIPKPRLAPPGAERVCHVIQPAVHDPDAIEPVDVGGLSEPVHPHARRLHQLPALGPRDGLERAAERRPAACLHFHKGDQIPLTRDQVDFRVTDPESMRHDVASTRQEVTDRLLLAREAAPLALVLPVRRIAPQPALHGCKLIASP